MLFRYLWCGNTEIFVACIGISAVLCILVFFLLILSFLTATFCVGKHPNYACLSL